MELTDFQFFLGSWVVCFGAGWQCWIEAEKSRDFAVRVLQVRDRLATEELEKTVRSIGRMRVLKRRKKGREAMKAASTTLTATEAALEVEYWSKAWGWGLVGAGAFSLAIAATRAAYGL